MRLPPRPTIYELNTAVWLRRLGTDLAGVPASEWDRLAALGVDAVWLMGVWSRSPVGLDVALRDRALVAEFERVLPDLRDGDVLASPYCVRAYEVEPRFGGPDALAAARAAVAARGIGLVLDFVPNHVAPDHDWTAAHPDYFVAGSEEDLAAHPQEFVRTAGGVLANGRDPYFAPWRDVVQVDAFSPGLRAAAIATLRSIAEQCDGVRCDMAMLVCNEVFARTWGARAGAPPAEDYWPEVIGAVHATHPQLVFIAEAYWDMEWALQQQGFDYCYDKRLYDRLVHEGAASVRAHLQAGADFQERLVRFVENHDEPRAADTFGTGGRGRAAAVVTATLQGARLLHDGQLDGLRTRIPVFLTRGPQQAGDAALRAFYETLLRAVADSGLRDGAWRLCDCTGWPDNRSHEQLLAWCWRDGGGGDGDDGDGDGDRGDRGDRDDRDGGDDGDARRALVVVNFHGRDAQARVRLPWDDLAGRTWTLRDALSGQVFERDGDELASGGLYVGMAPWESYFLVARE